MKPETKKHFSIFLMLFCSMCLCIGQFVWKIMPDFNLFYILSGFIIYAFGAVAMILAYRYGELSVLQPMNSMSYIFSSIIAIFILHEKLTLVMIIGILLIITGVIVIGVSKK